MNLALPEPVGMGVKRGPKRDRYEAEVEAWCNQLLDLKPRIEVDPGVRGWCYILEGYGLSKGDFDRAEKLINDCRKKGLLPLDFTTDDTTSKWAFSNVEAIDGSPEDEAERVAAYVKDAEAYYSPVSFWDFQEHYVQMVVEKSALKRLFDPVCAEYRVALGIAGGSWSINMRVNLLLRFAERQDAGNDCVLLNCFDHDPAGLLISDLLRRNLEELLPAFKATYPEHDDFDLDDVKIERFGLNADFVDENGFTWIQGLMTASGKDLGDTNHRHNNRQHVQDYIAQFGERKVEGEALLRRPDVGRDLCRQAILEYIDRGGIEGIEQKVDELRSEMRGHLDRRLA